MEFTPFTVIAGTNASGKSNLFDALKLLARLAEADNLKKAFKEQRGEFMELFTQYSKDEFANEMEFCAEMLVSREVKDAWGNIAQIKYTRLRYELKIKHQTNASGIEDLTLVYEHLENLKHHNDEWIKLIPSNQLEFWRPKVEKGRRGIPYIETKEENGRAVVLVPQDGVQGGNKRRFTLLNATRTVLSSFDTIDFPHVLAAKEEMKSWRFLELTPDDLRQPTNKNTGEDMLSQSGKNLAAVLYRIKQDDQYSLVEISRKLQTFIPNFIHVDVIDDAENNQYLIKLTDKDKKEYTSRVLSEGTLRILALCILDYDYKHIGLLCFEEPENGIHPFRIKDIANLLKDLSTDFTNENLPLRQVIVNTHSSVLVSHIFQWPNNNNVSIWYARLINRVTNVNNNTRVSLTITGITPVIKEHQTPLKLIFSEPEQKLTLKAVQEYLETTDNLF